MIRAERMTAQSERPFVVVVIGMRFNRLFAMRRWWFVLRAMRSMMRDLSMSPRNGLLGAEPIFYWRGVATIQYWESYEALDRFANDDPHRSAWRDFYAQVGLDGSVGIWHETYLVDPDRFECIYGNMPPFGLARALGAVPASGALARGRGRLGTPSAAWAAPSEVTDPGVSTPDAAHEPFRV